MKICVIGSPSTGKSVFARTLSAEMGKRGINCELVQEYASAYIQQVGAPEQAWEQLVISIGQYLSEQKTTRDHMVTDAAAFATYVYAQRALPKMINSRVWPKYRHLLDMLRTLARISAESYDLIFLLTHVFLPRQDGVRLETHLSYDECKEINRDMEVYLESERVAYHRLKANSAKALGTAIQIIEQRLLIQSPQPKSHKESDRLTIGIRSP
ncbi:MAG: AAA family ATPase [Candidatus Andersenbacteria bacterium]